MAPVEGAESEISPVAEGPPTMFDGLPSEKMAALLETAVPESEIGADEDEVTVEPELMLIPALPT